MLHVSFIAPQSCISKWQTTLLPFACPRTPNRKWAKLFLYITVPINSVWLHDCNITVQYNEFLNTNYKKKLFLKYSQLPWNYLWSLTCRRQSKLTNDQHKWRLYHKEHGKNCTPLSKLCSTRLLLLLLQITYVITVIHVLNVSYCLLRNRDRNLDQK